MCRVASDILENLKETGTCILRRKQVLPTEKTGFIFERFIATYPLPASANEWSEVSNIYGQDPWSTRTRTHEL